MLATICGSRRLCGKHTFQQLQTYVTQKLLEVQSRKFTVTLNILLRNNCNFFRISTVNSTALIIYVKPSHYGNIVNNFVDCMGSIYCRRIKN